MKVKSFLIFFTLFLTLGCSQSETEKPCPGQVVIENSINLQDNTANVSSPSIVILGTIQDAGSPQLNCHLECCERLHNNPDQSRMVVSLGLIEPANEKKFIIEASPDISQQLSFLSKYEDFSNSDIPNGVLLTHAHTGHYTGLLEFGKESVNTSEVPVYAMPRMKEFLSQNGPWNQLVTEKNIFFHDLNAEKQTELTSNFKIIPFLVPHRDEYSETVGYKIIGPNKSVLFIPDIDKWEKWEKDIIEEVQKVDYAFIDATFFDMNELADRDMSEVPHPFMTETSELFKNQPIEEKNKIYFIHFNHTNPILNVKSAAKNIITNENNFNVAEKGMVFSL